MGIFDDAIREHLDLKRRQGADESELQQLEDEAFGPPARPGDPDFPETGESEAEAPAEPVAEPEAPEAADEPVVETSDEAPPHGDALLADPEATPEPPPADDEGPVEDSGASDFSTTEREAIAAQPTEFFEQAPEPLDLDELDLDLKDELDQVVEPEEEELGEEEEPVGEATPERELEVVEEAEPKDAEPEEIEPEEIEDVLDHEEPIEPEDEEDQGDEAEDVLEETPEFLRDNPDDDELWFEQGKPKDFEF
jgi:hypothetical protein